MVILNGISIFTKPYVSNKDRNMKLSSKFNHAARTDIEHLAWQLLFKKIDGFFPGAMARINIFDRKLH